MAMSFRNAAGESLRAPDVYSLITTVVPAGGKLVEVRVVEIKGVLYKIVPPERGEGFWWEGYTIEGFVEPMCEATNAAGDLITNAQYPGEYRLSWRERAAPPKRLAFFKWARLEPLP